MPVTLRIGIFDLPLVKPKCVSGVGDFFSFQLFIYNFQKKKEKKKNPPLLKNILALPMAGQICTFEELQPFEIATFDLGHPIGTPKMSPT